MTSSLCAARVRPPLNRRTGSCSRTAIKLNSAAAVSSPAADKQLVSPVVAGAHGNPRAASSSADSTVGARLMDDNTGTEFVCLGQ